MKTITSYTWTGNQYTWRLFLPDNPGEW